MARRTEPGSEKLYAASARIVDVAFRADDSILTPGAPIWTAANIAELRQRFVEHPDEGKNKFEEKLRKQLRGASDQVVQLAGEILYIYLWIVSPTEMGQPRKLQLLADILSSSRKPVAIPADLAEALDRGIVRTGTAYHAARDAQFRFLVLVASAWKALDPARRASLLADPWQFKAFLEGFEVKKGQPMRLALLHIVFPDEFEPIVSREDKSKIAAAFVEHVTSGETDVDKQLLQIRRALEPRHGAGFNFYSSELKPTWREEEPPASPPNSENKELDTSTSIEERIDGKLRRAIPDAATRDSVLKFLAFAVENADEERSDAWRLRETRRGLELKAGRMSAFRIDPGAIGVSVVGPIADDVRLALGATEEAEEDWKKVAGGLFFTLPAEKAASALDLLKEPFAKFVDAAIARVRRDVDLDDHVPEAIAYLSRAVGRELPQPEPRTISAADERDDVPDDEPEVSREPRIRGRAPIFEHGQRAIASLIEDIDPQRGTIALPDLQRPFVWEDTKVRDLLDSIFIGFPVGTLVFWHTSEEKDARALGASKRGLRATTLVIDGQQRLTSLYSVMRGKEIEDRDGSKRLITIAFRPRDGKFEVADAAIRRNPEFIANVTELWNGPRTKFQIRKDLLKTLADKGHDIDDAYAEAVDQNLERAQAIKDYRFPTVDIRKTAAAEEATEEDVADIFVRINNQGTRLGQAEFVLTLLSVFHGELRDRIETRARQMSDNGVLSVDTQQVLRMACAVGFGRARMSAVYRYLRGIDPITGDADPARRVERLDTLDHAAGECVDATRWRDFMLRVTHAGFVSQGLLASTNAVVNAYAFYILGRRAEVPKSRLDEAISRWLFATLLTARYSASSETKFEEDLARIRDVVPGDADGFIRALDEVLSDTITGDYWTRSVPAALETQRSRAPMALAFRAAQVILGSRALFSDQLLQNLLNPPGQGGRTASEMHHLFPKAWLREHGVEDRRRINQVANLADVGWHENSTVGKESPAKYVPRLRSTLKIDDDRWGRMCAEHALPLGWESMDYATFLESRRPRMAEVIRIAYRKLGGEADAAPLTPPWFLPGAEAVWQRIAETERALRGVIRQTYAARYGSDARGRIEATLNEAERERLARALRSLPSGADPLRVVDYLYLAQLPPLLFVNEVWSEAKARLRAGADFKDKLRSAVDQIAPVRNEIAHVREVSPDRLQRANVACNDVLRMLQE